MIILENYLFSTPKGKLIQTVPRVDHHSLRNKKQQKHVISWQLPPSGSLSLPATSQIIYLATLLLAFSLCLSHIWCFKYDAFNKHVYKPVIYSSTIFTSFYTKLHSWGGNILIVSLLSDLSYYVVMRFLQSMRMSIAFV